MQRRSEYQQDMLETSIFRPKLHEHLHDRFDNPYAYYKNYYDHTLTPAANLKPSIPTPCCNEAAV